MTELKMVDNCSQHDELEEGMINPNCLECTSRIQSRLMKDMFGIDQSKDESKLFMSAILPGMNEVFKKLDQNPEIQKIMKEFRKEREKTKEDK